ncbi:MAG: sulfatase [Planctomycetota bacterium]
MSLPLRVVDPRRSLAAALLVSVCCSAIARAQPPNIVLIVADDLGWCDVSTDRTNRGHGSRYYQTPNVDALAAAGMSFDSAYTNGANCAPTRAALMSGQHAARTGVYAVASSTRGAGDARSLEGAPNTQVLAAEVVTLAETLQRAGYATGHFGKWHLGNGALNPAGQGFDCNVGGTQLGGPTGGTRGHFARADGSWRLPKLPANGQPYQFMADRLTTEAVRWLAASGTQPMFCYLSHFSVHTPIQAPQAAVTEVLSAVPTPRHSHTLYAAMIKNLDNRIGDVVRFLERTADPRRPGHLLIENTVLVFTSDNGGVGGYLAAGVPGAREITSQAPLRSGKGSFYEGGIRVPLIVRWDGVVRPGAIAAAPVQVFDLYPTLAELAGAPLPVGQPIDGEDLGPLLRGGLPPARTSLFWHYPAYLGVPGSAFVFRERPVSVIRRGDYKLRFNYESRTAELYDVENDLGESVDLAAQRPDLVRSMVRELRAWLKRTDAALPRWPGTTREVALPSIL